MFIFIAHAEADQAAADDLKAFLKTRGLVVETETGARGFRHLQASDVVIALWSQKSVFGAHKMQMEKRMLDAWADQQLVLVKLDHGFLPVGMRDLPAIDASFEQSRKLSVWPQVERAAREAMNRALAERQAEETKSKKSTGASGAGGAFGGVPEAEASPRSYWDKPARLPGAPAPKRAREAPAASAEMQDAVAAPAPQAAAPPPPPSTLFISYAHADNAQVEPVVAVVTASGRAIWIDKTGIQTGDGWAGEIVRAIKGAKGVLVMCSKHAFESDHVKREVYLADRYKKPMAPVFLEAAQPPEDFEYFFASVQWLELWKLPEADRPAAIGKALEAV